MLSDSVNLTFPFSNCFQGKATRKNLPKAVLVVHKSTFQLLNTIDTQTSRGWEHGIEYIYLKGPKTHMSHGYVIPRTSLTLIRIVKNPFFGWYLEKTSKKSGERGRKWVFSKKDLQRKPRAPRWRTTTSLACRSYSRAAAAQSVPGVASPVGQLLRCPEANGRRGEGVDFWSL